MLEILPIRLLTQEDAPVYGTLPVSLGMLSRAGLEVASGIAVTAPSLKLKTTLEHFDFGSPRGEAGKKEVFEQTLNLVKKEIYSIKIPDVLTQQTGNHKLYYLNGKVFKSTKDLWQFLLELWMEQIKTRIWNNGFYLGITDNLDTQIVLFIKKPQSFGTAYFDPIQDDVVIQSKLPKLTPQYLKQVVDLVNLANKKLYLPYEYEWIFDGGIKLCKVLPLKPLAQVLDLPNKTQNLNNLENLSKKLPRESVKRSAIKVFYDLSSGFVIEKNIDGVYISSEKVFNLDKPRESFDNLVFKIVESSITFEGSPVFVKLADVSEGYGKLRGSLRLLHQKSLFEPMMAALDFARHKKGLLNVHIVVPFVRHLNEFLQIKRELSSKKLMRKNSLQIWMEICVPENILNIDEYLNSGLDGVVLNLDELVALLNGYDLSAQDLLFYKHEVGGLIKFLTEALKTLHKQKIPFIAYGTLSLSPKVLDFLVENGVYGVVVDKSWSHSAYDLLYQAEKRMILKRT